MIQLFKPLMSFLSFLIPERLQGTQMAGIEQNILPSQHKIRPRVGCHGVREALGRQQSGLQPTYFHGSPHTHVQTHSPQAWAPPPAGPEQGLLEGKIKPFIQETGRCDLGWMLLSVPISHLKK